MTVAAGLVQWGTVDVAGSPLDVHDHGSGDPVIFIGTALVADRLLPVALDPALDGRRVIAYRRRGYGSSAGPPPAPAVDRDARDLIGLMDALGLESAALVGFSHSAAVALETAALAPERASALVVIDAPPVQAACGSLYRTANAELLAEYAAIGAWPAADRYLWRLISRGWRHDLEKVLPGAVEALRADAETFFAGDLPALMSWRFERDDAARITAPTLLVTGSESPRWYADEICALHEWIPEAQEAVVAGGRHTMTLTHPHEVAAEIATFLDAHSAAHTEADTTT